MTLPPDPTPHCLACQAHIDYAELLVQDLQIKDHRVRELERKLFRLQNEDEEPIGKRKAQEHEEIKEWLARWEEIRMTIPGSKKSQEKTLGPESSNAKQLRMARRVWSHEELMACLNGAGLSNSHTDEV